MIDSVPNSERKIAFLLQCCHTTGFGWLTGTERKKYLRSRPKTDALEECVQSIEEIDPWITLWKAKTTIVAAKGASVSQQLVPVIQKTLGYSLKKIF